MKINKALVIISMVFISLLVIGAVSAADDIDDTDVAVITDDNSMDVLSVDDSIAVENKNVIKDGAEGVEGDTGVGEGDSSTSDGNRTKFNLGNVTFNLGNGTSFNLSSLLNGSTISLGNGTSFNISSLMNGNMSFGNGTSFNISSILNTSGENGTFDISSILGMLGGNTQKVVINATDIDMVYAGSTTFKATITEGNSTVAQKTVIFTINNKDYVKSTNDNGVATLKINLAAGTYFIYTEYNNVIQKNKIVIKKAASKLAASAKTYKAKTKTKKFTITLKNNKNKVIKNAKVTLKVNGKTYKATTNSKGKATFKITKLTKVGKHTATIKFAGNGYYKASSKSVKITVKK